MIYHIHTPPGHPPCHLHPATLADAVTVLQSLPTGSHATMDTSPTAVAWTCKGGRVSIVLDSFKAPSRRAVRKVRHFSTLHRER